MNSVSLFLRRRLCSSVVKNDHFFLDISPNNNITQRIISGQHDHDLKKNIILSQTAKGYSHIELTKEHIRIEYNTISKEYQESAQLYFETDEEILAKGIPLCFKPVKIENKISIGAGATIYLDRGEVADFLIEQTKIALPKN